MKERGVGQIKQLTDNTADENHPAFSPDGTKIAFFSARNNENGNIY